MTMSARRPPSEPDVYDIDFRSQLGDHLLKTKVSGDGLGSGARSRLILAIIGSSFPTKALTLAYFENLECLLRARTRNTTPGQLVCGLGSGRCGSTSLTALLSTARDSCCTHENPPLLDWLPALEQIEFHVRRFSLLVDYFGLVFDAAHWWLNAYETLLTHFPAAKAVGMWRDTGSCARSFAAVKGTGIGSTNHWTPPRNGIWRQTLWDPAYPSYPVPPNSDSDPDGAKLALIER